VDAAITHYIEAGAHQTAIAAALEAKQILKAAQLLDDTVRDPAIARPFYVQIARHYQQTGALEEAEKFYLRSGQGTLAVDMYMAAGRWENSFAVARQVAWRGVARRGVWAPAVAM
jgi:intraflagellar transport protein 172